MLSDSKGHDTPMHGESKNGSQKEGVLTGRERKR